MPTESPHDPTDASTSSLPARGRRPAPRDALAAGDVPVRGKGRRSGGTSAVHIGGDSDRHGALGDLLNRGAPVGCVARRRAEVLAMSTAERIERAAEILAIGLVRLLQEQGKVRLKEQGDGLPTDPNGRNCI